MLKHDYEYVDFQHFLTYLESEERYRLEYDNGYIYYMSPVSPNHERVKQSIQIKLLQFLEGKSCEVFTSEIGVRFKREEENYLFEPDIMVVCDNDFNKSIYQGLPKFIVEIMSYATMDRDIGIKKQVYEKYGVPEYWIVDPFKRQVTVYHTNIDGNYRCQRLYTEEDEIQTIDGFKMLVKDIFKNMK